MKIKKQEYTKAQTIEDTNYVCSICDDEPEYCFECEKSLDEDEGESIYYCDGCGQHLCVNCYKKIRGKK